jgi:hypothetical protein
MRIARAILRSIAVVLAAGGLVAVLCAADAGGIADIDTFGGRPPGVSPDHWIPINDRVGIVITRDGPALAWPPDGGIGSAVQGFLVVRKGHAWVRLLPTGQGVLLAAHPPTPTR